MCSETSILKHISYRKHHFAWRSFHPEVLYDVAGMECAPLSAKKEVMAETGASGTNGLQALQGKKE